MPELYEVLELAKSGLIKPDIETVTFQTVLDAYDRLRLGDLVAGTWVVRAPTRRLLPDMAIAPTAYATVRFDFTPAQLDAYGVKELQVLEDVLRRRQIETIRGVAERIRVKIGWTRGPDESDFDFLDAYYAALRRRLEQLMLLGRRRKDKHDRG